METEKMRLTDASIRQYTIDRFKLHPGKKISAPVRDKELSGRIMKDEMFRVVALWPHCIQLVDRHGIMTAPCYAQFLETVGVIITEDRKKYRSGTSTDRRKAGAIVPRHEKEKCMKKS